MSHRARGTCPNCLKEVVETWESHWSKIDSEPISIVVDCPFCQGSRVLLTIEMPDSNTVDAKQKTGWFSLR